ncbi:MAG: hypothetical protein LBJ60_00160 [Tannerellaceae bacterium]|jgi:hypothetical protein|nr:hypothetical protein [Tannerellaceae bacterium]
MQRFFLICLIILGSNCAHGQSTEPNSFFKRYFAGSSMMMLGNFSSSNKPDFVQLNFGYRITSKDIVSLEAITWKYAWPLGIPYGKSLDDPKEKFPGYIREYGVALAYQRFLWKGLYVGVHALNAKQSFIEDSNDKIKNGYQLFMTYRSGYHISFFKNRFFIEPSIAVTHRLIHTRMPESFARQDNKWSKFFVGEPGLHFGFNF